jgi:hypothetical protein
VRWIKSIFYWIACLLVTTAIVGLIVLHYLPGWTNIDQNDEPPRRGWRR